MEDDCLKMLGVKQRVMFLGFRFGELFAVVLGVLGLYGFKCSICSVYEIESDLGDF